MEDVKEYEASSHRRNGNKKNETRVSEFAEQETESGSVCCFSEAA